jgi:glycosyltransferase involved in cell wall biosynthesis
MRILVLCKRQYTRRDLLDDRYGRLWELPLALARRDNQVQGICLSYKRRTESTSVNCHIDASGRLSWHSLNAGILRLPGLLNFARHARQLARQFRPDIVWSASDSFYGVIGDWVARATGAAHVFDIYDNFESFGATRLPGMRTAYRAAVRRAHGVTCVSEPLREKITGEYRRTGPVLVLPNGIDPLLFHPEDRESCKHRLGLPVDAQLIGVAGAITRSRGIATVFEAAARIMRDRERVHLVLAGSRDPDLAFPDNPRVHDLGILPYSDVPMLINALDVAIISNRDSEFGRYCFPQKAHEYLACRVPVVASDVGAMHALFQECPQSLFRPEDPDDLVRAVTSQLDQPCRVSTPAPDWNDLGAKLDMFLHQAVSRYPTAAA